MYIYYFIIITGNDEYLFTSKLDLNLRKKLVNCYMWNEGLFGAETWTLRELDQEYVEFLKFGFEEGL
jgi:hypothetical protein